MSHFQSTIKYLLDSKEYKEPIKAVLQLIVDNNMYGIERDKVLADYGIRRISDLKEYTLDVFIDYANLCLADDDITEEEYKEMRLLKLYLGIEEGDFSRNEKINAVKDVLVKQINVIYADGKIDYDELLHMDSLQGVFGLSYNEFHKLIDSLAKL